MINDKEIIISPILYMGNKTRLIKKGLTELFPKNIDTFIDVFAGSGVVSMNTKAKKYILNDIDLTLQAYYKMFLSYKKEDIIKHIKQRISDFKLPQKTTIRCYSDKNEVTFYKKAYHSFRETYNKNKNILDLYTLMFFAFSQQFRINKNGDFNMPFGNNHFSSKNEKQIINGCEFFSKNNVKILNKDFEFLIKEIYIKENDFLYFDSPYSITTATYNENSKWNDLDDERLFSICESLNKKGIRFGISNVFVNKGIENKTLQTFCKRNKLKILTPKNFQYHACGKENKKQQEVFICNYEINHSSFFELENTPKLT